jgi:hypothetical protein
MSSRRKGAIALGILVLAASVVWLGFWALVAAWVATDDSDDVAGWLFLAGMSAVGIVGLSVGLFLVVGRFPGRIGWIVVALVAALPVVPAVLQGLESKQHVASVVSAAQAAYAAERGGDQNATATCTWEDDDEETETWRCTVTTDAETDVCFLETSRTSDRRAGHIDRCENDAAKVERAVQRIYRARGTRSATAEGCFREEDVALWRCDLRRAPDRYCFVEAEWPARREPEARVAVCERQLLRAVSDAYRQRSGRQGTAIGCVEDEQNDGIWSCRFRSATTRDTCIATFDGLGAKAGVALSSCEQDLVDAVERLLVSTGRGRGVDVRRHVHLRPERPLPGRDRAAGCGTEGRLLGDDVRERSLLATQPSNQRARRLEPNCCFSAASSADGGASVPVGFGPERKSMSTRPTRPPPNST